MNTNPGHLTEFWAGFTGTCGQCALEEAFAAADGRQSSEDEMVAVTHEMQQHSQAAPNGASTLWSLAREAERRGYTVALEWDYEEPFNHDWHTALLQNAGVKPIVLQLAQAHNLRDIETGAADEAGVQYHFICILDKHPDGYVANDGDNPQVMSRYQAYNYQTLINAVPCGLLVLEPKESPVAVSNGVPSGWKDDGKVLTAPNGVSVTLGFRDTILGWKGGWPAFVWPAQEFDDANQSNLCLSVVLHWEPNQPVTARSGELPPVPAPVTNTVSVVPAEVKAMLAQALNQFAIPAQLYNEASDLIKKYGN